MFFNTPLNMVKPSKKDLHLLILNGNIRLDDSQMVNVFSRAASEGKSIILLLGNETNKIKNNFDV